MAPEKKAITVPIVSDMLSLLQKEIERIVDIEVAEAKMIEEKGSIFSRYTAKATSLSHIRDIYMKIKYWHPEADHVMVAVEYDNNLHLCADG